MLYVFLQLKKLHNEMPLASQALADFNDDDLRDMVTIGEKVVRKTKGIRMSMDSLVALRTSCNKRDVQLVLADT